MSKSLWAWAILCVMLPIPLAANAQNDVPSQFPNAPGIVNTRHNMTQNTELTNTGGTMNPYRNRYGEVCVYCHTPHAANSGTGTPLWNRLLPAGTSFTTYDQLGSTTLTQTVYKPGAASLACLSCHDGSQAVDAILNMPGSGNYSSTANPGSYVIGANNGSPWIKVKSNNHLGLDTGYRNDGSVSLAIGGVPTTCMSCHNPGSGSGQPGDPTDFTVFLIGKDLRNDHPVGVTFPAVTGGTTDWKTPNGTKVVNGTLTTKFFDENGNGRMDKTDIRMYDTGNGATVECGSCHDPHGISGVPTFLRKANAGSAVCLTCHSK